MRARAIFFLANPRRHATIGQSREKIGAPVRQFDSEQYPTSLRSEGLESD